MILDTLLHHWALVEATHVRKLIEGFEYIHDTYTTY